MKMKDKTQIKELYNKLYLKFNYSGTAERAKTIYKQALPFYFGFLDYCYKSLNKDQIILEYGHGDGVIMRIVSDHVKEINGVDISEVATKKAKRYLDDKINCFLYCDDNINFFPDNKFDLIFEVTVFQHMLKCHVEEYLEQFYRKLKPDGVVLTQIICDPTYSEKTGHIGNDNERGHENMSSWTEEEYRNLLLKYKYKILSFNHHDLSCYCKRDGVKAFYVIAGK